MFVSCCEQMMGGLPSSTNVGGTDLYSQND